MQNFENRIKYTKQGYAYVEVSKIECLNWGGFAVCDTCNYKFNKGYLVYVLNGCVCEECFKKWIKATRIYKEDLYLQEIYAYQFFKYYLNRSN